MTTSTRTLPRVFVSKFSDVDRWDPSSFHAIGWSWPDELTAPLRTVLDRRVEKVDKSAQAFSDLTPITIHFDGSVEHRRMSDDISYSMDLLWAHPGDLVASKIDLKNGAMAVIPDGWNKVVVTNHFAVYKPRRELVDPRYLHLVVQTDAVKSHLWRNKVGAEGRKEVKLEFFESLRVPMPSVSTQEAIVSHWDAAQEELKGAEEAMSSLIRELNKAFLDRTSKFNVATTSRAVSASWVGASQWDVNAGRAAFLAAANPDFLRLGDHIEECSTIVRPWDKPDHEWPVYGVSNKVGVYLNGMKLGHLFTPGYTYQTIERDWFFHNPTRANVGSLGIVPEVQKDSITSPEYQVWKIKSALLPKFVDLLFQTAYFLKLVSISRVGGVKQRLFFANLAEIRLPRFSLGEQADYAGRREDLTNRKADAIDGLRKRKIEIEQIVLGKQAPPA